MYMWKRLKVVFQTWRVRRMLITCNYALHARVTVFIITMATYISISKTSPMFSAVKNRGFRKTLIDTIWAAPTARVCKSRTDRTRILCLTYRMQRCISGCFIVIWMIGNSMAKKIQVKVECKWFCIRFTNVCYAYDFYCVSLINHSWIW